MCVYSLLTVMLIMLCYVVFCATFGFVADSEPQAELDEAEKKRLASEAEREKRRVTWTP